MADQSPTGFGPCLKNYLNNISFSDAVIRCGNREFAIHRIVLCCHSEYFAKQLDGPWKESYERAIEIVDFDVSLVEAMIYFTYHLNYDIPNGSSAMVFNAKMYQIADKYAMSTLKTFAQGKFSTSIKQDWEEGEFPDTISLVYTSTPSTDRELRDIAVITSLNNLSILIDRDDFKTELASNADFAIDIIRFQGNESWNHQRYTCKSCQITFDTAKQETTADFSHWLTYCPSCRCGGLDGPNAVKYNHTP